MNIKFLEYTHLLTDLISDKVFRKSVVLSNQRKKSVVISELVHNIIPFFYITFLNLVELYILPLKCNCKSQTFV